MNNKYYRKYDTERNENFRVSDQHTLEENQCVTTIFQIAPTVHHCFYLETTAFPPFHFLILFI